MAKYEIGQYIELHNDEGEYLDEIVVMGHVFDNEADDATHGLEALYGPWKHKYARWSMESAWDGNMHILRVYNEPGRGRFKVTWAELQSQIDYREDCKNAEQRMRQMFQDKYPGATILRCNVYDQSIDFIVDGMDINKSRTRWKSMTNEVILYNYDLPHWEKFKEKLNG